MTHLLRADLAARRRQVTGLTLGTFAFFLLVQASVTGIGGAEAFADAFGSNFPPLFTAFAGARSAELLFSAQGLLGFMFNHPFFLTLAFAVGISIGTAAIAGDVESGRSSLLYARPLPRARVLWARVALWALAQACVVTAAVAGALLGVALSPDLAAADTARVAVVALQFLPLAATVAGLAFAASAWSSSRGRALGAAVGVTALAYLANFVSLLWSPAAWLRWLTPFGYYEPLAALEGFRWGDAAALGGLAVVLFAAAGARLQRRDLA